MQAIRAPRPGGLSATSGSPTARNCPVRNSASRKSIYTAARPPAPRLLPELLDLICNLTSRGHAAKRR